MSVTKLQDTVPSSAPEAEMNSRQEAEFEEENTLGLPPTQ